MKELDPCPAKRNKKLEATINCMIYPNELEKTFLYSWELFAEEKQWCKNRTTEFREYYFVL